MKGDIREKPALKCKNNASAIADMQLCGVITLHLYR